jgi:hypothetical protein
MKLVWGALLLIFVLIISGCTQTTGPQNEDCTPPYIPNGDECCLDSDSNGICDGDEDFTPNSTERECSHANPCPDGYFCFEETDCGLGPEGPVECPQQIKDIWDYKCHMECGYTGGPDCPNDMPYCEEVQITDYVTSLCFECEGIICDNPATGGAGGTGEPPNGACSEPIMFDYPPADIEKVMYIRPLGCVGGSHVTPIDHQYLITPDYSGETGSSADVDVYSPAAGRVTSIQHMGSVPTGDSYVYADDYRVVIRHTCSISSIFIHIDEISDKLKAVAPPPGEYRSVNVDVGAGEVIGRYSGSLDYNVVDEDVVLTGFVVPESYNEPWKTHTPDPFNYFNEPHRGDMIAKSLRTDEPPGGKIDYDIDGRLIGTWFLEGTNKYEGLDPYNYWAGHLSIIYDCYDPGLIVISFGDFEGSPRDYAVKGNSPDPADVSVDTGILEYELIAYDYYDGDRLWDRQNLAKGLEARGNEAELRGVVLFQLIGDRRLKMEIFPDKSASQVEGFSSNAKFYER